MATERIDIVVTEKGARTVRRNIENIGKGATSAQGAVQLLRRSLGALGGALVLGNALRTLAQFSQEMSTVRAVTGATEVQFKALRDIAKDLGATTRFSATQAAEGMTFLARAGFTTNEVMATIGDTLNLAQAGALELGSAADIASNVLKGFNLEAAETTRIVDTLVNTANKANTDVEQLGQAMSFLAPAAAAVGVSVEQASAAVGALSDAGVQSTRAGTSLRQIFIKTIDVSKKGQKVLEQYGLTTADVNVKTRGLVPVLESLRAANISLEGAAALVGSRQAANLLILTQSIPKIKELTQSNKDAAGTAAEVARIMDDNLNGALISVKSAFEAVIIAIGDLGSESFLTNAFRKLADALRFVAKNIDDVAAAAKIMAGAFVAMRLPRLIGLFRALAVAIALNPFTALVVGITAATAALTVFRDEIKLTEDGTITLGDAMTAAGDVIGTSLTEAVNSLGGTFENFDQIVVSVVNNFSKGLVVLAATTNGVVQAMIAAFKDFPRALKAIARSAWNGFLSITEFGLNTFVKAINKALDFLGISKELELFDLDGLKAEGETAGDVLGTAFKKGFDDVLIKTVQVSAARRAEEAAKAGQGGAGAPSLTPAPAAAATASPAAVIRESTDALDAQRDMLERIRGPQKAFEEGMAALNKLLADGKITMEEFRVTQRDLRIELLETQTDTFSGFERGFLKATRDLEDFASASERLITDAYEGAQEAVVGFFKTGKFEMDDFFRQMADNFLRLGTQQLFAAGQQGFGNLFGGGGGGGGGGGIGGLISSGITSLLGFQNGGSFTVGANSAAASLTGIDNRLIAFRAADGEKVTVTPKNERGAQQGPINQVFNVTSPDANSFRRSQTQLQNKALAGLNRARSRR